MSTSTTVTKRRTPPPPPSRGAEQRSSRDDSKELLLLLPPRGGEGEESGPNNKSFASSWLHVKLTSLLAAGCFVWWCRLCLLDPVWHYAVKTSGYKKDDDHHSLQAPEVIYPRAVVLYVYNHDDDAALGEARAVTNFTNEGRHDERSSSSSVRANKVNKIVKPLSSNFRFSIIGNSADYEGLNLLETAKLNDCQVKHEWQRDNRLNCNSMFEATDLTTDPVVPAATTTTTTTTEGGTTTTEELENRYKFLANGYFRDVLMVLDSSSLDKTKTKIVFKPMRYEHDYDSRNFARMRRDALTMEQLTGAKHILNIYASCGTSGLFEYADGGDIKDAIWFNREGVRFPTQEDKRPDLTRMEKLHIATQAAMGLASFHNMDEEGKASVAHTDISPSQWIKVNGVYKLNDFNRGRFLKYSKSNGTVCPFYNLNNWGTNRAPEEYLHTAETEMVDVYSFGNIMYMLLQGEWPFVNINEFDAMDKVTNGERPWLDADIWNSTDPVDQVLKDVMIMSWAQDQHERKTARQIETYLKDSMRKLDPGRLEEWGDA